MASPVVEATAVTNGTTASGGSATINVPDGITTGDLLIVSCRNTNTANVHSYPAGWTKFAEDQTVDTQSVAYREVDGTEGFTGTGDTIQVAMPNTKFAGIAWRISGAEAVATQAPQTSTVATGTSDTLDPTTVTPTGGSKDYLFLWLGGCEGEQTSPPTGNPTNYTNPIGANSGIAGAATSNCTVFGAQRALTAASEDPGSWTTDASDDWAAWAIAVHPAAAGGQTVTGVALSATPSLPAGALTHTVTGAALSATPTLPAGALTHTLAGTALTATPSLPAGSTAVVDLKAWWDFADASTLYEDAARTNLVDVDGDLILGVADKSGGGEHAVQSTSTKAPLYKTGIINGLSVARFDGTDDWITNLNTFASDASWTLFMVAQKRSAPSAATDTLFSSHAANAVLYTDTDVSTGHNWSMNQASGQVQLGGTPANVNIIAFRINSASSMDVYHNGNSNWDNFDPNDSITTAANLVFGANVTGADAGDYDIGEIIIYSSALSDENLDILGNYLGTKWGVTWTNISGGQTVTGAVLTVTPSLPAGSLTHRLTGVALSATPSLPAGTLRHSLTGVALSATPTMPAGLVAQTNVLGTALTIAPTFPSGSLRHALTGVALTATPTFPTGQVATTSLLGAVLTVLPTLPAGTVSAAAEDTVSGIVLTVIPTLPVGALTHRLTGAVLTATPTLPAGLLKHSLAGAVLTVSPSLPAGALTHRLAGVVLTATPSLPVGTVTTAQIVQGAVLTLSPTLPVGSVSIPLSVSGQVLDAFASLPVGSIVVPRVNQPSRPHTAVIKRGIPRSGQPL